MKQPLLALSRSLFCKHKPTTFLSLSNGTSTRLYSGTGGYKWNDPENEKLTPEEERKYKESYEKYNQRRLAKRPTDQVDEEFLDPRNDPDYRLKRIKQLLKEEAKNAWSKFQDPLGQYQKDSLFPSHVDVLIIGGAAMGSSIAHFIKKKTLEGLRVAVVDRDLTYARASTCLSAGGLRQQFSLKENIEMSLFGADFLRNIQYECYVPGEDEPTVNFAPHGYLYCATEKGATILEENHALQTSLGAKNVLLTPEKIKQQFPWMNTDGIALACHGLEKEGWFDPWLFLSAVKRKAMSMGVEYVRGEVVKFLIKENPLYESFGFENGKALTCNEAVIRDANGKDQIIRFSACFITCGAFSGEVARLLHIGDKSRDDGFLFVPMPVEPRKRYVYCFECPDGPGVNTPMVIDTSGSYFRREGLGNYYTCGRSPVKGEEEPSVDNLDVDYEYFNEVVWPHLAHRVKAFENLKVSNAWAGYYDFNYFDENAILGNHPAYNNIFFATGFSGHGIQQAAAVGNAMSELFLEGEFRTIDLSRFLFERIIQRKEVRESNIL